MRRICFDLDALEERPSPHVNLWRSVLWQALEDARRSLDQSNVEKRLIVQRAREWLLQSNKDFEEVCALASVASDRMRAYARQLIGNAIAKHNEQANARAAEIAASPRVARQLGKNDEQLFRRQ